MHSTGADMTTLFNRNGYIVQQHRVCVGVLAPTPSHTTHILYV